MKNTIKKAISVLLVAVMVFGAAPLAGFVGLDLPELNLFSTKAKAEEALTSGICGENLIWTFDESTGIFTVSGTGNMIDYQMYASKPWYSFRDSITALMVGDGVTGIGKDAFSGLYELKELVLPDSLLSIGENAFSGCSGLESILIPCGLINIGDYAFSGCSNLGTILIPKNVSSFGYGVFQECNSLEKIIVDENNMFFSNDEYGVLYDKFKTTLLQYPAGNKQKEYMIPDGVIFIGEKKLNSCRVFAGNDFLQKVTIPEGTEEICSYAFEDCLSLVEVVLPYGLYLIGTDCFSGCISLENISIPESVTTIGSNAFDGCESLTEIDIKNASLFYGIFRGCINLEKVNIGSGVKHIESDSFYGCNNLTTININENNSNFICEDGVLFSKDKSELILFLPLNGLSEYTIPNTVNFIHSYAFANNKVLTEITIPDSVKFKNYYSYHPFAGCSSLSKINISKEFFAENLEASGMFSDTAFYNDKTNWQDGALYLGGCLISVDENVIQNDFDVKEGTVAIAPAVFAGFDNLISVNLPNTLKTIGNEAFKGCSNLTDIDFGTSLTNIGENAFSTCISLSKIVLPNSIESIKNEAFYGCLNLKEIFLGDNIKYIGLNAFAETGYYINQDNWDNGILYIGNALITADSENMTGELILREDTVTVGRSAFQGIESISTITIPSTVKVLNDLAFDGCVNLESVSFEEESMLEHIGAWVFGECESLQKISIPRGVITIGNSAFEKCKGLTSVTFEGNSELENIGENAFAGTSIEEIFIPQDVLTVSYVEEDEDTNSHGYWLEGAFVACDKLSNIKVDENNLYFSSDNGVLFNKDKTELIKYPEGKHAEQYIVPSGVELISDYAFYNCELTSVIIPDGVISIGEFAFCSNYNLKNVAMPNSVKNVGVSAFENCYALESVNIPESMTEISYNMFDGCHMLRNITLPDQITTIGSMAFYDCYNLENIVIPGSVTSIESSAFKNCNKLFAVDISKNVINIGDGAFEPQCELTIDIENVAYSTDENGSLYNKNKTKLIEARGTSETYNLADSVIYILPSAFLNCSYVSKITVGEKNQRYSSDENGVLFNKNKTILVAYPSANNRKTYAIPDGVRTIGEYSFVNCKNLYNVYVPYSVKQIVRNAFGSSGYIDNIYYAGSSEEWNRICEDWFLNSTIHFGVEIEPGDKPETETDITQDSETDISIEYTTNDYNGEVAIDVERSFDSIAFDIISAELDITDNIIYDIKMTVDGVETQPNGTVKVRIPMPEGYNPAKTFVYHIDTNSGRVENMNAVLEIINGKDYLVFETDHFSYYAVVEVMGSVGVDNIAIDIRTPSKTVISYGDSIILHADLTETLPSGCYIEWTPSNGNFGVEVSSDSTECKITPSKSGDTIFTATIYDSNGNAVSKDKQTMTSKAGFFDKIIAFFKKLFGLTKVIPQAFKGIY